MGREYTPYYIAESMKVPDSLSMERRIGHPPGSREDVAARLAHMQHEGAAFLAANGYGPGTPLHTAHQNFVRAAEAWRTATPGLEADKALEIARRAFDKTVRAEYRSLDGGNPAIKSDAAMRLGNLVLDTGETGHSLERHARQTNPELDRQTVGNRYGAFWRQHAPELFSRSGTFKEVDPDIRGSVEPERARRTGGLDIQLPIPPDLPRLVFADAGPTLANLGRPSARVAPDPAEAERTRTG